MTFHEQVFLACFPIWLTILVVLGVFACGPVNIWRGLLGGATLACVSAAAGANHAMFEAAMARAVVSGAAWPRQYQEVQAASGVFDTVYIAATIVVAVLVYAVALPVSVRLFRLGSPYVRRWTSSWVRRIPV
jgi:hypothetical protein